VSKSKRAVETEKPTPLPLAPELLAAHPGIEDALTRWKETHRIPPVLLLTGPRGCGKRDIAYYIAQTLQCERSGFFEAPTPDLFGGGEVDLFANGNTSGGNAMGNTSGGNAMGNTVRPCGECPACLRAVSGQTIDFTEVRLDEDERTLGVDRFREIKEKQGFSSFGGGARIYLISDADTMTVAAANSVLKMLEEPPAGWVFLLTVADPSLLPSTVVSRCQMLRMRPLDDAVVASLLGGEDLPSERIATVAKLAEGSLTRARELAGDDAWEARGEILQFIGKPETAFHKLIDYAAGDPAHFRLLLDQFEQLLSDLIRSSKSSGIPYRNLDAKRALEDHAKRCAARKGGIDQALAFWIDRSERLFKIRREMTAPLNAKVLVQDFLAPWMDSV
jgi:DNA polymerase III delta prime subunit